jgi:hypothetical protein
MVMNNKIFFLIVSMVSPHIVCMDQQRSIQEYRSACEKINAKQEEKLTRDIRNACCRDLKQEISLIENKFERYSTMLHREKQTALDAIQKFHTIDQQKWNGVINMMDVVDKFNKEHMCKPLPNVVYAASIPADLKLMMCNELLENGIHPEGICLRGKKKSYPYSFQSPRLCYVVKDDSFFISEKEIFPCAFKINVDIFLGVPFVVRRALCIRMAESYKLLRVYDVLDKFQPILVSEPGAITNGKPYKALKDLVSEKLTVLLPALRNQETASIMKQCYYQGYNPSFASKDFKFLSKIERNWRVLAELKKYACLNEKIRALAPKSDETDQKMQEDGEADKSTYFAQT